MPGTHPNYLTDAGNPTPKWNGHSLTKIRNAGDELSEISVAERVFRRAIDARKSEISNIIKVRVSELVGIAVTAVGLGFWSCSGSPTLGCVYDLDGDPLRRVCVFCQEPNERD